MGSILGCRVHFFANERTLMRLQQLVKKKFSGTPTEFSLLEEWGDLLLLTGQVNYDHLFVVISARRGSISYDPVPRPVRRSAGDCVFLRPAWLQRIAAL